jgi:hypothetical protein
VRITERCKPDITRSSADNYIPDDVYLTQEKQDARLITAP